MFRRRPIRRPLRPLRAGMSPGQRRPPKELIAANRMLEAGDYPGAAAKFEAIARVVESRGGPRAPQFYLQAGRARILAGEVQAGMAHIRHALDLLVQRADWPHLHRAGNRAVEELNQRGLVAEADEIAGFLQASLPADFSPPSESARARKPVLPTHCPSCGGLLRPDEVNWLDPLTAECAYCGSPVREEK